jgi:hypothetical protein
MLSKQGAGYAVKGENKVGRLFYMDDLKLFSRDETDLQRNTVKTFCDIGALGTIKRGLDQNRQLP